MRPTKKILPEYLRVTLMGFEDDNDEGTPPPDDDDDDTGEGEKEDKGDKDQGNDGLKSALRKERQERRRLEKELKAFQKFKEEQESKDKSDTEKAKDEATKAKEKAERLAARLRVNAVDNEIIKAGTKLKFRDLDDALKLINRDDIEVEQDEDDPSDVQVDAKSVEDALKALAKAKPHLLVAEGEGTKSGSKFGGGQKSQEQLDEEALMARYPALRRGSLSTTNPNNS